VTTNGLRVLVVDDEELIRWAVGEELVERGHTVLEASDGQTAKRILRIVEAPIDAVLLDYQLPDSRDLGLLQDVRRLSPKSAVVMMTAYGDPGLVTDATRLGAYAVIDKPFELRSVGFVVADALSLQTLEGPFPALADAVESARRIAISGTIWHQSVDERGRLMGDPIPLPT
jgi:DNA-binding NtrC family response regulator